MRQSRDIRTTLLERWKVDDVLRLSVLVFATSLATGACASAPVSPVMQPVVNLLCDKDVVLLGELPSHGEAKSFGLKAAIVQDLVNACDFDAVLFEAPIYDFVGFSEALGDRAANAAQLDDAIGRFWLTRELAPFRAWLYSEASGGRLMVGGLDDQLSITSHYGRRTLPEMMSSECKAPVRRNLEWTYNDAQPFDASERQRLRSCAGSAASNNVMLRNLKTYVDRQVDPRGARTRDEVMHDNLQWYLSHMPARSKVIVWTATVHAARKQGDLADKPFGAFVADRYGQRVASVGFTALGGQTSMAGRPAQRLPDLPQRSLEASVSGGLAWVFLDGDQLARLGSLPSRVLGRTREANWREYFDAVVVVRDEVAPVFEQWR